MFNLWSLFQVNLIFASRVVKCSLWKVLTSSLAIEKKSLLDFDQYSPDQAVNLKFGMGFSA